jgi:hypothetical protein
MSDLRLMENWLFDSAVDISASSEDTSFPVSNLAHEGRYKTWRSSGHYTITSSNNRLDYKDASGGSELSATITVGEYTADDLCEAIEVAMQAVSALGHVYTVSYSDGYFTIATSGAYLKLLWNTGTNTASTIASAIGFSSASDNSGATTYTSPNISIHTEEYVVVDLGTWGTNPVDSVAIVFDGMVGNKLTSNAVVKIQASQTNVWTSPTVDTTLTFDDTYLTYTHFYSSDQSYRYWRLKIVDTANPYLYVEVPKLILSDSIQLTQVPSIGFGHTLSDPSTIKKTPYGQSFGDILPTTRGIDFSYRALSAADLEDIYELYTRVGKTTPIGVALDSQATLFDKDRFFMYGRFNREYAAKHDFYSYFDIDISFDEAL